MRSIILTLAVIISSANLVNAQDYKIGDRHPEGGIVFTLARGELGKLGIVTLKDPVLMGYDEALKYHNSTKDKKNNWGMSAAYYFVLIKGLKELYPNLLKEGKYWIGFNSFDKPNTSGDQAFDKEHTPVIEVKDGIVTFGFYVNNKSEKAFVLPVLFPDYRNNGNNAATNTLEPGSILKPGDKLTSANSAYILSLQDDGNLCVYNYNNGLQGSFVWGTMKHGFKDAKCQLNADGNLVVYEGKMILNGLPTAATMCPKSPLNWCWRMTEV